jgi:hypothetical protein
MTGSTNSWRGCRRFLGWQGCDASDARGEDDVADCVNRLGSSPVPEALVDLVRAPLHLRPNTRFRESMTGKSETNVTERSQAGTQTPGRLQSQLHSHRDRGIN